MSDTHRGTDRHSLGGDFSQNNGEIKVNNVAIDTVFLYSAWMLTE